MSTPELQTIDVRYAATVLAVLVPPLAVYLNSGEITTTVINVVLCFGFYLPGIIHAVYKITKSNPDNGKAIADTPVDPVTPPTR